MVANMRSRRRGSAAAQMPVLVDGGGMSALIRAFDWSKTPVGPMAHWPASLWTVLNLCLASDYPMAVLWGDDFLQLYNDACCAILGTKHPQSLGQPCRECWPEIWDTVGPLCEHVRQTGRSTHRENIRLVLQGPTGPQERFFTLYLSPVLLADGSAGGVLVTIAETTTLIIAERRSRVLRALANTLARYTDAGAICRKVRDALADEAANVPFAAIYLRDAHADQLYLAEYLHMDRLPAIIPLAGDNSATLDLMTSAQDRLISAIRHTAKYSEKTSVADVEALATLSSPSFTSAQQVEITFPLGQSPAPALVLPLSAKEKGRVSGVLVAGVDSSQTWNEAYSESYQSYLSAFAIKVAASLVEARIIEIESQRMAAQARATEQTNMFATSIETITDGVYIFGPDGELVQWNAAARNMTPPGPQMDLELFPGAEQMAYVPCDEHGRPFAPNDRPHQRALRGETFTGAQAIDVLVRAPDGRNLLLSVSGAPMYDASGHITGAVMVARDITERRMLERRTRSAFNALLAMAETLVLAPTSDRNTTAESAGTAASVMADANQTMRRLGELARSVLGCVRLGISLLEPETLKIQPVALVGATTIEHEQQWQAAVAPLSLHDYMPQDLITWLAAGETIVYDLAANARPEAPNFGLHQTLVAPMRRGTRLIGVVSVDYGNVEHRYSTQELELAGAVAKLASVVVEREQLLSEWQEAHGNILALRSASERMEQWLDVTGHEFKNPLTTIRARVQLIKSAINKRGTRRRRAYAELEAVIADVSQSITRVEQQTTRLTRMVDDLLDSARIHAGKKPEIHPALCSLTTIVQAAIEDQRLCWPNRTITLTLPDTGKAPIVMADADRIQQVVVNYVVNALKYSGDTPPVEVSVDVVDEQVRVSVRDQGPGLLPEEQERVWLRYHRGPVLPQQNNIGVGLGLGLYISKVIIELHNGRVGVESTPGEGATFFFTLPLAQTHQYHRTQA